MDGYYEYEAESEPDESVVDPDVFNLEESDDLDEPEDFAEADFTEEDDDPYGDDEMASEFIPGLTVPAAALALYRRRRRKRRIRRARPRRSYTSGTRGRRFGMISTPAGSARIRLPARFPTITEFRRTVGQVQKDIRRNSAGIKDLLKAEKNTALLATRSDKALERRVFGLQIAVVTLAVLSLPQAASLVRSVTGSSS